MYVITFLLLSLSSVFIVSTKVWLCYQKLQYKLFSLIFKDYFYFVGNGEVIMTIMFSMSW